MRIDLLLIETPGNGRHPIARSSRDGEPDANVSSIDGTTWPLGQVLRTAATPTAVGQAALRMARADDPPDAILHWGATGSPDTALVNRLLAEPDDVWHAGLRLGLAGLPGSIDDVAPTWMLNRDPDPSIEATSWRLSLQACLVRREVIDVLGHVDDGFDSLTGAGLELGHRWINHGARMRHVPDLVDPAEVAHVAARCPPPTEADEYRFVDRRYGRKWLAWAVVAHVRSPWSALRSARAAIGSGPSAPPAGPTRDLAPMPLSAGSSINGTVRSPTDGTAGEHRPRGDQHDPGGALDRPTVTVLIPTVERYPSLKVVLDQLRRQTVRPDQVIVVDQTPAADRQPELLASFADLPLQVFTLEQAGQCTARNTGLDHASGDLVLFIDDDDEIADDLIELHLRAVALRRVEVSSGVVHEPNGPPRSAEFERFRVSDTFPTNNSMVSRAALDRSGWFDTAFDRGERADHDLGMRLYLSGARMVMDPAIDLLHNHAPRGGLRVHNARAITYGGARASIRLRQPVSPTQIYLWQRYYSPAQVRQSVRLHLAAGLFGTGPAWRQLARLAVQAVSLPVARREAQQAQAAASTLSLDHPQIPRAHGRIAS